MLMLEISITLYSPGGEAAHTSFVYSGRLDTYLPGATLGQSDSRKATIVRNEMWTDIAVSSL